jgi:hypothetical protein
VQELKPASVQELEQASVQVLVRFADPGRTVAAPAGAAQPAAKCSNTPGTHIPGDAAASQPLPTPLPLSPSPSPSPRLHQQSGRGGSSEEHASPRGDGVLPAISFPSERGCNTPSDPARRERSSLDATEIPVLHGEGASSTASTTEQGEGELRPLSARAQSRGTASLPATACSPPPPFPPSATALFLPRSRSGNTRCIQGRLPAASFPGGGDLWRIERGGASGRHLSTSPLGPVAPWRSEVGPAVVGSFTPVVRILPHGATIFFPVAASPPPLPPRAGANG